MVPKAKTRESDRRPLSRRGMVMRISLAASLLVHVLALAGIQRVFPFDWWNEPLRTYEVELLRPPVEPLENEPPEAADVAQVDTKEPEPPEPVEDTISLNTEDKRYSSYAAAIKEQLMRQWQYPPEARENLMEGQVLVLFTLDRGGRLLNIQVVSSSAHEVLDLETMRTVRSAAPFPPFPGSISVKRLHIKANFAYRIASRG